MQKTIFAILTNKKARTGRAVEKSLDKEFAAGAPWLGKDINLLPAKPNAGS